MSHADHHSSGKNSTRSTLNSIQWFGDFVQGNVSPTDIVLSRVERRLLPPLASQNCAATPHFPIWLHSNASVTAKLTEHRNMFGFSGNSLSSWLRTDPSLYGYTQMNRIGLGVEWSRGQQREKDQHQHDLNGPFSSSALRVAVFGELCAAQLQSWTTGATFTLPNLPFVQQIAIQSSSRNFGLAYLRGEIQRPTPSAVLAWVLFPFLLFRSVALWLLHLIVGERMAAAGGSLGSHTTTTASSSSSSSSSAVLKTDGKVERLSAQESIARAKQLQEQQQKRTKAAEVAATSAAEGFSTAAADSKKNAAESRSASKEGVIVTWHASASYQKTPFFVMLRLNAALPLSQSTELSLYADPLRRCHVALCTQLIRNRVDAGMRLRLNTISWKDSALDVGALCNIGSVADDGRPLCIGAQFTGNTLQLFADVTEESHPGAIPAARSSSASSWLDFGSVIKSLRCGVILTKFPDAKTSANSLGTDFFFKVRF